LPNKCTKQNANNYAIDEVKGGFKCIDFHPRTQPPPQGIVKSPSFFRIFAVNLKKCKLGIA
jgi:hypothetical protein